MVWSAYKLADCGSYLNNWLVIPSDLRHQHSLPAFSRHDHIPGLDIFNRNNAFGSQNALPLGDAVMVKRINRLGEDIPAEPVNFPAIGSKFVDHIPAARVNVDFAE